MNESLDLESFNKLTESEKIEVLDRRHKNFERLMKKKFGWDRDEIEWMRKFEFMPRSLDERK